MSKISLSPDVAGTGIFTIASPGTSTNRTLTLPDDTGTIVTNSGNQAGSFTTLNTSGQVVFNDAGADVDFRVEGDTDANLLFVDASTDRVGIGTSSPSELLTVGAGTASVNSVLHINGGNADARGAGIKMSKAGTAFAFIGSASWMEGGTSNDLAFSANSGATINMRINSSGNVGIGTNAPAQKLDIIGGTANGSGIVNTLRLRNTGTTVNDGAKILFTAGTSTDGAGIGSGGQALNSADLRFFAGGNTERARITSGGYFKASNNGTYQNATASFHEFVSTGENTEVLFVKSNNASYTGDAFFVDINRNTTNNSFFAINYFNRAAGAYKFRVADSGNVTNTNNSYGSISDIKLKQDIVDAASQWDDIKNLRVRKYHWKSDPDGFMQMGLVAQEAELISPGLIDEHPDYEEVEVPVLDDEGNPVLDEDGNPQVTKERNALGTTTKAIKYSVLYMKAVKALQEAIERIETLEAKVAALEAQ